MIGWYLAASANLASLRAVSNSLFAIFAALRSSCNSVRTFARSSRSLRAPSSSHCIVFLNLVASLLPTPASQDRDILTSCGFIGTVWSFFLRRGNDDSLLSSICSALLLLVASLRVKKERALYIRTLNSFHGIFFDWLNRIYILFFGRES